MEVDYSNALIQHIDLVGFNYEYQRKIESQKGAGQLISVCTVDQNTLI